jgi:hypothetical protein
MELGRLYYKVRNYSNVKSERGGSITLPFFALFLSFETETQ